MKLSIIVCALLGVNAIKINQTPATATATGPATAADSTTGGDPNDPHCPAPAYVVYDGPNATDGWHCESPPTPEQQAEQMAQEVFGHCDSNHNALLTKQEVKNCLR